MGIIQSDFVRSNILLLESIQEKYEHPEHFTIPLSTQLLLELISTGSTAVTAPGGGQLRLTIVALPPVHVTPTAVVSSTSGENSSDEI